MIEENFVTFSQLVLMVQIYISPCFGESGREAQNTPGKCPNLDSQESLSETHLYRNYINSLVGL